MGIEYEQVPVYDEATYPAKPQKKKASAVPRGRCSPCVKVLLVLLVVFVVVPFVLLTIAGISGYIFLAGKVKSITVTEPRLLPIIEYPDVELELAKDRVELYFDDLKAGRVPAQNLVITANEINGFIAKSDYLRGNAFVHIEENTLTIETSLPTNFVPGGKGRYFVASAVAKMSSGDTLSVNVDAPIDAFHGKLLTGLIQFSMDDEHEHHVATLVSGQAFGKEPCEKFYKEKHNSIVMMDDEDDDDDDDFLRVLNAIETISLENEQIVFKARQNPKDGSTTEYVPLSPWNLLRRLF